MAIRGRAKAGGPVDKAVKKLRKQNIKLRKRISKDMRTLSADAKLAVGLEERLRRLEAQIAEVTALIPAVNGPSRSNVRPNRPRTSSSSASASRGRSRPSSASSRTSSKRSGSRSASGARRPSRTHAA
jgi:hypothetical protein